MIGQNQLGDLTVYCALIRGEVGGVWMEMHRAYLALR